MNVTVAIHGIRTGKHENWTDKWVAYAKEALPDWGHYNFEYGWLSGLLGWFFTWAPMGIIRHRYTRKFWKFLLGLQKKHPEATIHILAHSYGTWIAYHAIRHFQPEEKVINIGTVILVGGVLPYNHKRIELRRVMREGLIQKLINYCSPYDAVVENIPFPFGCCGYKGFGDGKKRPSTNFEVYNMWTEETHSSYFLGASYFKEWKQTFKEGLKTI